MALIEDRLAGDPTNWWVPNHAGIEAMLCTCGLRTISNPIDETYNCIPDETHHPAMSWNQSEFLSASSQPWETQAEIKINKVVKEYKSKNENQEQRNKE